MVKVASEITIDKVRVAKFVIIFTCCFLSVVFLKLYNGVFLKNTRVFQYSISVMISAVVCEWISVSMSPLWEHLAKNATTNSTNSLSSHNEDNFGIVLDIVQSFLQPFFAEFLSISATCLINLWQTMRKEIQYHIVHEEAYGDIDFTLNNNQDTFGTLKSSGDHIDNDEATGSDQTLLTVETGSVSSHRSNDQRITWYKLQTSIVVAVSVCVNGLFVTVCSILPPSPVLRKVEDTSIVKWINNVHQAVVFTPLILLINISLFMLNKRKIGIRKSKHFTSTDYLLLFTSLAIFVYNTLNIFSLIRLLAVHSKVNNVEVAYKIIFWLVSAIGHVWGQTQLIMTAQYIRRSQQELPKFVRFTLIYLVASNLGLWMCDSIKHKWTEIDYHDNYGDLGKMFGDSSAKVIILTFLPIWDIYSFHSAIVVYNIVKTSTFKSIGAMEYTT